MIQLTLAWFVFIYLIVFLAGILTFWIGYEMLQKQLSIKASRRFIHCRICGALLATSPSNQELLCCPSCGSFNEPHYQGGL